MRENRTYGSEGGEVLTHFSDPIKSQLRPPAICGRQLAGDRTGHAKAAAAVTISASPGNTRNAAPASGV